MYAILRTFLKVAVSTFRLLANPLREPFSAPGVGSYLSLVAPCTQIRPSEPLRALASAVKSGFWGKMDASRRASPKGLGEGGWHPEGARGGMATRPAKEKNSFYARL